MITQKLRNHLTQLLLLHLEDWTAEIRADMMVAIDNFAKSNNVSHIEALYIWSTTQISFRWPSPPHQ